ncbi:MAG: LysM peptidoglycan-binding domain-containing protein [Bacteroidetes bacterium]|nr:LysM peptidoglycan-binding domain-containing protein [Bacteroidota bacterium]MCH8525112.1 LysM peptidoglycan-binding domain-containing protein [Balneolales bacterium]
MKAIVLILLMLGSSNLTIAESASSPDCSDESVAYIVQPNDNLYRIAMSYGDYRFWQAIYIVNANTMQNPHRIFPDQEIKIPRIIVEKGQSENLFTILSSLSCSFTSLPANEVNKEFLTSYFINLLESYQNQLAEVTSNDEEQELTNDKTLEQFRAAFNALIQEEQISATTQSQQAERPQAQPSELQQQQEQQIFFELDGMLLDETITKIGRDFYDVFYANWQAPSNASNFSITISEQPSPNLGTVVSIQVNERLVYRNRLQPRFEEIEQAGIEAVRHTYFVLSNNLGQQVIY